MSRDKFGEPGYTDFEVKLNSRLEKVTKSLGRLLETATKNEHTLKSFQNLERKIMRYTSFADLIQTITVEYRKNAPAIRASIYLVDKENTFRSMLLAEKSVIDESRVKIVEEDQLLREWVGSSSSPRLSFFDQQKMSFLVSGCTDGIKSIAVCPIWRRDSLIGSIILTSKNRDDFNPKKSIDFLEFYCEVVAIAIENAMLFAEIRMRADFDALTQIHNRMYFNGTVEKYLAVDPEKIQACFMIDIDKFKHFNDAFGHPVGDMVIKRVAMLLRDHSNTSDLLSRFGGEEFMLMKRVDSFEEAHLYGESIRQFIEMDSVKTFAGQELKFTVSIGISVTDQERMVEELISVADNALYEAKGAGRNCVVMNRCSAT